MRTSKSLFVTLCAFVVFTFEGTIAGSQNNMACVMFHTGCQGYTCYSVGDSTCTDQNGVQHNWNRMTQGNGTGFLLGTCQPGSGNCNMATFPCNVQKYWNTRSKDEICDQTTFQCTDAGSAGPGCKGS